MFQRYSASIPQKMNLRIYGSGPAIILFHSSPNSGSMMHSLATNLANHFTVICPDTPGYGSSEKLDIDEPSMSDFVIAFKSLFDQMGLTKFAIYGTATGAQIAIRYGIEYPADVHHLYLDNCAHFTDEERSEILKHYFPDLTPNEQGAHLDKIWEIVTHLFKYFPWCFKTEQYKINVPPPPPKILHAVAMDYMASGADYDIAYKAAFNHEKVDYIQQLTTPTTILRWQGSILKTYTNRIFDFELPDVIQSEIIPSDPVKRYENIAQIIAKNYAGPDVALRKNSLKIEDQKVELNFTKLGTPPMPVADGTHLKEAWLRVSSSEMMKSKISNFSERNKALALQKTIIQWYRKN